MIRFLRGLGILIVWLLSICAVGQAHGQVPYAATFKAVAGARWKDRAAQIRQESGFNPAAVSPVGARGLAQFMPSTWSWAMQQGWVPAGAGPFEVEPSLVAQHRYMAWLEARCEGRWSPALGAYNAGLGNVRKAQLLAHALGMKDPDAWLKVLPQVTRGHAVETQGYVQRIKVFRAQLEAL